MRDVTRTLFHSDRVVRGTSGTDAPARADVVRFRIRASCTASPPTTFQRGVTAPVIGFPRGAGSLAQHYADTVGVDAVALDTAASAALGKSIQERCAIQGALDPLLLRAGGAALDRRVDELLFFTKGECETSRQPINTDPGSYQVNFDGGQRARDAAHGPQRLGGQQEVPALVRRDDRGVVGEMDEERSHRRPLP